MTVLDVDSGVYLSCAKALTKAADDLFAGQAPHWQALAQCTDMAGSYSEAKTWAASYDQHAQAAISTALNLAIAVNSYGNILAGLGHNHQLGEWHASGSTGTEPPQPPMHLGAFTCGMPLPSAGGPGNGLTDSGIGLIEKVGIPIPDGNTGKLAQAADHWTQLANHPALAGLPDALERMAAQFDAVTAPEVTHIHDDLRALKKAATDVKDAFTGMANTCRDHHTQLDTLRAKIKDQLTDLAHELAKEIAITAAISIGLSVVSFGLSAAGGAAALTARTAAIVARFAPPIRTAIDGFKAITGLAKGVTTVDLDALVAQDRALLALQRMERATPQLERSTAATTQTAASTGRTTQQILRDGVEGSRDEANLNRVLNSNTVPSAAEGQRIREFDDALKTLPKHEGPALKHTNLTPEQLASYVPGKPVTEKGFFQASAKTAEKPLEADTNNTVFLLTSKTGRKYGQYSNGDEHLIFGKDTNFMCRNVVHESKRTLVYLDEL